MKISVLISELQEILDKNGDKEVMVNDFDVNSVYYDNIEGYVQIEG